MCESGLGLVWADLGVAGAAVLTYATATDKWNYDSIATATFRTDLPTDSTIPENSCPGMCGRTISES